MVGLSAAGRDRGRTAPPPWRVVGLRNLAARLTSHIVGDLLMTDTPATTPATSVFVLLVLPTDDTDALSLTRRR